MNYIYNDEDNAPMNDDPWDGPHNPTVYGSRAEMKAVEQGLPFTDPPEPVQADRNCHERCRFSKYCYEMFHEKGSNRADFPAECGLYYKLEDLEMDARDIAEEQRRARGEEEEYFDE